MSGLCGVCNHKSGSILIEQLTFWCVCCVHLGSLLTRRGTKQLISPYLLLSTVAQSLITSTLFFIWFSGTKLTALSHEKLPAYYEEISIRGSELAIAGWKDKKILLFHVS